MSPEKLHKTVKEGLLESDFYQKYKEQVEFNAMDDCSDAKVICELVYDLVREIAGVIS